MCKDGGGVRCTATCIVLLGAGGWVGASIGNIYGSDVSGKMTMLCGSCHKFTVSHKLII